MNFPDNIQTFTMSPTRFASTDAIDVRLRQVPMNNESLDLHSHLDQTPLAKRPRTSMENLNDSPRTMNTANPAGNKGTSHIFYKTRICAKFRLGTCRNGENCNFAHGADDVRQPPPNWQEIVGLRGNDERSSGNWDDDHKIIHKMKLCKKFYNGEECPYGERCSFLHEDPGKFREDSNSARYRDRESSVISIGTTSGSPPKGYGGGDGGGSRCNSSEGCGNNRAVNNGNGGAAGLNVSRGSSKGTYWKTKLCIKWETTGHCPFGGDCHFAHGQAELQAPGGRAEAEVVGAISASTKSAVPNLPNVISSVHANEVHPSNTASVPPANEDGQGNKSLLKWKGFKKINRIYGDWLDDFPLVHNLPSRVET
ncbi:zinc finger CCCH domain-containing protein 39 [Arachis stenosperma]|uniref:zinc finger CCCH domain-containing protein 39 n=1 Tax=Arachis stenosperma TaxID=217475 RepID=UPI0025AD82F3|nr:zinc finger CCCH domain-containing protein 39 [Arachis stenosperma]